MVMLIEKVIPQGALWSRRLSSLFIASFYEQNIPIIGHLIFNDIVDGIAYTIAYNKSVGSAIITHNELIFTWRYQFPMYL